MPELPDITVYQEGLQRLLVGQQLLAVRVASPFVLRTVTPAIGDLVTRTVDDVRRLGKRLVFALSGDHFMVLHLMIAGRLAWKPRAQLTAKIPAKVGVCAFDFSNGTLLLTEASPKKRASLHLVQGALALALHDPGGVDVFALTAATLTQALTRERHTLKRTLTDPRTLSGIGNAYSDEILHRARLSPVTMSDALSAAQTARLLAAITDVLTQWTERLRAEALAVPLLTKVTAFRPEMAVHGKAGHPCPVCASLVQRIAYANNETNYCATCQTDGKLLADRAMSRLMKDDWPRTLEELELLKRSHSA